MASQAVPARRRAILSILVLLAGFLQAAAGFAQTPAAQITYPIGGAINADLSLPIRWTAVGGTQAYYLYLGTTVGAKDLADSGELQQTSYLAAGLPAGPTVFARLWTVVGGTWRFVDSSFTVGQSVPISAVLTSPLNGATNVDPAQPVRWTTVPNALAYYLYLGSTPGANDIVNTGEVLQTSYIATGLPAGRTVFVRLWTKGVGGTWRYVDTTFSAAVPIPVSATLTYPADGADAIDQWRPASWTSTPGATSYYLYIGSVPGAKDLVDSNEIQGATTFSIAENGPALPAGPTLYARLWTEVAGAWQYRDSTFTASPMAPAFVFPTDAAIGIVADQPFAWVSPANADKHRLRVGTTIGANDITDSGEITGTSALVASLPATGVVYARALSRVNGTWRYTDIAFTREASIAASTIVVPVDGQLTLHVEPRFEWSPVALARGYRLTIGTTFAGDDLHDSGEINVTRRFVPGLPIGVPLYGRVATKIAGVWAATDFTFRLAGNTLSAKSQIDGALWATDMVRQMAPDDNHPFSWTELARRRYSVHCSDYSVLLLQVLVEMNLQLASSRLDVALNPNTIDAHTLVELFDPDTASWMLLDPTFDLTAKRTGDGAWASVEDMSAATMAQRWGDITYVFLGSLRDHYARTYVVDYPLLFVNIYHSGELAINGVGKPILQFYAPASMSTAGSLQTYAIGCSGDRTAILQVDGVEATLDCSGVDGLSYTFRARTIAPTSETSSSVELYRSSRFVF